MATGWATSTALAQWTTQTVQLKAGWSAIYLHVDASHVTIDQIMNADPALGVQEIWRWAPPASTLQFVTSPQTPLESSLWQGWTRDTNGPLSLQRLVANSAYLVRTATNQSWSIQGRPVVPEYNWTTTGLNFIGFPSVTTNPPTFETFLLQAPDLQTGIQIFNYNGGDLSRTNPGTLFGLRTAAPRRGEAFWIRAGTVYNRFFSPFEVVQAGRQGVDFGDSRASVNFRLRNLAGTNVTVTMQLLASESAPAGTPAIAGTPRLFVRGDLNTTDLTYAYSNVVANGTYSWTLAPQGAQDGDVEVVLGLDRTALAGGVGSLNAGILRFTDSLRFSQVDVPLTATVASRAGLWVGDASITSVGSYLKTFQVGADGQPLQDASGQYLANSVSTNMGSVLRPFPLRLIVHNPEAGSGNAKLLKRVFVGTSAISSNVVASVVESALDPKRIGGAKRLTAAHLPWSLGAPGWSFDGRLGEGAVVATSVLQDYADHSSNPFLHTYHPDHDNLDATFASQLPKGSESYDIRRDITLRFAPASTAATTFSAAAQSLTGTYEELLSIIGLARSGGTNDTRVFSFSGTFTLNRISSIPTLTTP